MVNGAGGAAHAHGYPDRPVRFILPSSVGDNADIVARLVGESMGRTLGQALVINNRGGANGIIGTAASFLSHGAVFEGHFLEGFKAGSWSFAGACF